MKIKLPKFESTYWKLTRSFVLFGMLPMFALSITFFMRYSSSAESLALSSMLQMSYYLSRNIEDVIDSVDETMGTIYDYKNDDGMNLVEILQDDNISARQKMIYTDSMLRDMLQQNSCISSIRFVTSTGQTYSVFYNSEKSLTETPMYCDPDIFTDENLYRDLIILPTEAENKYCANTNEYVFTLVRNYMNTSSITTAKNDVVATMYADINVDELAKYTDSVDIGNQGCLYVYNTQTDSYIYHSESTDYTDSDENPLSYYKQYITGEYGKVNVGDTRILYKQIANTDYYVVIKAFQSDIRSTYMENITFMMSILLLVLFILFTVYSIYSGKLSEPARKLKVAMQEVQQGNLNTEVDIQSTDEMGYLADGFNRMIRELNYYINQVYVAQICQKEAELNALKMQIQPHFLYNTLDVIRMTALENDDEKTAELLESLSAQMRYVIGGTDEMVKLCTEIDNIMEYFTIIKVRYKERISIKINVADQDRDLMVPKLILQPIVENSIKHGLREKSGPGTVNIDVQREEENLEISIMDDGIGMSEEDVSYMQKFLDGGEVGVPDEKKKVGIGTKNISDRIHMNFGNEYGIVVASYKGIGTIMKIKLPIVEEKENVESPISR